MMEAVDERDGSLFGNFGFDVTSNGSGAENTEVLSLKAAVLVGLNGCDQQIVPELCLIYF